MSFNLEKVFAALPRTVRATPAVISQDPKGNNLLYCNGSNVYIRNISDPSLCQVYTDHKYKTAVARYSPSGFYICSGDLSGAIRIWDATQPDHITKNEFQPFSGEILDLSWTFDSQRIGIVGEGRSTYAAVILADTGASVGDLRGSGRKINSVDFTPKRPHKMVCGSNDNSVIFYNGPPFKFVKKHSLHSRFVNCTKISLNNDICISASSDMRMLIFDVKTAEHIGEFEQTHKGGIYGIDYNADGTKLVSFSADKTVKLWDIETKKSIQSLSMGSELEHMLTGGLWCKGDTNQVISLSLNGYLSYIDVSSNQITRQIHGHSTSISSMAKVSDNEYITGSVSGRLCKWTTDPFDVKKVAEHGNSVTAMCPVASDSKTFKSGGMDDKLLNVNFDNNEIKQTPLKAQPKQISFNAKDNHYFVISDKKIEIYTQDNVFFDEINFTYQISTAIISPNGKFLFVADLSKPKILIYKYDNGKIESFCEITEDLFAAVNIFSFSKNGRYLAVSTLLNSIVIIDIEDDFK
ncbi:Actin-interacting protein 1, partial [Intoshia linei]